MWLPPEYRHKTRVAQANGLTPEVAHFEKLAERHHKGRREMKQPPWKLAGRRDLPGATRDHALHSRREPSAVGIPIARKVEIGERLQVFSLGQQLHHRAGDIGQV